MEKIKTYLASLPELLVIYFSPAAGQVCWVILAVLTDTISGIWAATRGPDGWKNFTSTKFYNFAPKMLVYILVILLAYATDDIFKMPMKFNMSVLSVVTLALAGIELRSIDENFRKATGRGVFKGIVSLLDRRKK